MVKEDIMSTAKHLKVSDTSLIPCERCGRERNINWEISSGVPHICWTDVDYEALEEFVKANK